MRGPVVGLSPCPSNCRVKNTLCRSYYAHKSTHSHFHICLRMCITCAIILLIQPLLCPLCWLSFSFCLVSCFPCYGKVLTLQEWRSPLNYSTLNPYLILPFLPLLHFCTKNTNFQSGAESMTSHIKHTSERDPRAMTRGPTLSLYKSNCSKLPRKPGPWERVPLRKKNNIIPLLLSL